MDETEFRNAFERGVTSVGSELGIAAPPAGPVDFCALWPKAKPILKAIASVIVFIPIPGVGAGAGAVLNGLIEVGDQMYGRLCGA